MGSLDPDTDFVKPGEQVIEQPTLSEEERKTFIDALLIGQMSKTVDVFGHQVLIKTLTVDLELQVAQILRPWENTVGFPKAYKTASVAASIYEIDGVPFYTPILPTDKTEIVANKFEKLKAYYPAFVDGVYLKLTEMEQSMIEVLEKLGKSSG